MIFNSRNVIFPLFKNESISSVYLFFFSFGKQATMLIESSSIPKSVMLLVGVTVLYGSIRKPILLHLCECIQCHVTLKLTG